MTVVFLDLWFKLLYVKFKAHDFLTMHMLFQCDNSMHISVSYMSLFEMLLVYLPQFAGKFNVSPECCLVIKLPISSSLFDKLKIKF